MSQTDLKLKSLIPYGLMSLPLAFAGLPLYMHAPKFYADEFGVSLISLSIILLFLRGIDAIQDPILGIISDKYSKNRISLFTIAASLLGLGVFALFTPFLAISNIIWFGIMMFLATTGFSMLTILMGSLGSIWTKNYHDKTKISAFRESIILIGILIAASLPSILEIIYPEQKSLQLYSVITLAITAITLIIFINWYRSNSEIFKRETLQAKKSNSIKQLLAHKNYLSFFITYGFNAMAAAFPMVLFLFFIEGFLNSASWTGIFLSAYFLSGAISMPFWQYISKKQGKVVTWASSMLLAILSFVWVIGLDTGDNIQFLIICLISGLSLGADFSLPPSILSDLMDKTDTTDSAATGFSIQTFLAKFGITVASIIGLMALNIFGYDNDIKIQSEDTANAIKYIYALPGIILKILTLVSLTIWYKSYGDQNEKNQEYNYNNGGNNVL